MLIFDNDCMINVVAGIKALENNRHTLWVQFNQNKFLKQNQEVKIPKKDRYQQFPEYIKDYKPQMLVAIK